MPVTITVATCRFQHGFDIRTQDNNVAPARGHAGKKNYDQRRFALDGETKQSQRINTMLEGVSKK